MKKVPDPDPHHCTGMNVTLYWLVGLGLSFATGDVGGSDINVRRSNESVSNPIHIMVIKILDGNSLIGAHVRSNLCRILFYPKTHFPSCVRNMF